MLALGWQVPQALIFRSPEMTAVDETAASLMEVLNEKSEEMESTR